MDKRHFLRIGLRNFRETNEDICLQRITNHNQRENILIVLVLRSRTVLIPLSSEMLLCVGSHASEVTFCSALAVETWGAVKDIAYNSAVVFHMDTREVP